MILEIEQLLEKRLEQLSTNENKHFYLGFKECLGLFKVAVRKSETYNLHLENKRLKDELYLLKSVGVKLKQLEEQSENKKIYRSNFAKTVLAHHKKGNTEYVENLLHNAIVD